MAFINSPRFPLSIAIGAVGGPMASTDIVVLASGHEARNQNWSAARGRWDVASFIRTDAQRRDILAFFRLAAGRANGFRFPDPLDHEAIAGEGIFAASGSGYQLTKRYSNAHGNDDKAIYKPRTGTIVVKRDSTTLTEGVDYSIDYATGIVSMLGSPTPAAPTSWTGEFDVPARFDTDELRARAVTPDDYVWESIPIVEIRDIA